MANANIAIVNATSTFDQWRINTNDLITDRNMLRNSNYVKDDGNFVVANGILSLTKGTGVNLTVTNDAAVSNQLTVKSLVVTDTLTAVNFTSTSFSAISDKANAAYGQANSAYIQANLAYSTANTGLLTPVYRNGTLVATRRGLNIIQSTNMTVTVSDNVSSNLIDIAFSSTGGGGGGTTYIDDAAQNALPVGIVTKTAAGVYAARSVVAGTGVSVTNGNGVSGNVSVGLAGSGVAAGTYGNATAVPQIVVDSTGRVTSATNVAISAGGSTTPGGANTQLQFNNNGAFGGAATVTFESSKQKLTSSGNTFLTGTIIDTPVTTQVGSQTIDGTYAGKVVVCNNTSAAVMTLNAVSSSEYPGGGFSVTFIKRNTGNVTFAAGAGLNLLFYSPTTAATANIANRYSSVTAVYTTFNEVILIGDLT